MSFLHTWTFSYVCTSVTILFSCWVKWWTLEFFQGHHGLKVSQLSLSDTGHILFLQTTHLYCLHTLERLFELTQHSSRAFQPHLVIPSGTKEIKGHDQVFAVLTLRAENNWRKPWLCLKRSFVHRQWSMILKRWQNRIELVTRPDTIQRFPHALPLLNWRGLAWHHDGLHSGSALWRAGSEVQQDDRRAGRPRPYLWLPHDLLLLCLFHLPLLIHYAQHCRRCHHGQLRLSHKVIKTQTPAYIHFFPQLCSNHATSL